MKVGLIGPNTQVQHIENLFKKMNVEYKNMNEIFENKGFIKKYYIYLKELKNVDCVYTIGIAFRINPRIIIPNILRKRTINHWIGSDILSARKNKNFKITQKFIDKNLSCSNLISKELHEMGINSDIVPIIPSGMNYNIAEMPTNHSVLVYLPEGNEEFYGLDFVKLLAEKYPEIKFNIVANSNKEILPLKNVCFLGKLTLEEMEKLYNEISILLRLPKHDGLSLMLLEALAKGKEVIYSFEFPYTYTIDNTSDLTNVFNDIINNPPRANYMANEFIVKNYNDKVAYEMLINAIKV